MLGQRQQNQLWLWLLHWAEKGLRKSKNRKLVRAEGPLLPFLPPPWLACYPKDSPALVDGGATASPELGGGGTGGKGPMGGHSGNMPGGKGGRRPWATAERGRGGEKRSKLR